MCDMIDSQSAEKISRMKKLRRTLSESFGRIALKKEDSSFDEFMIYLTQMPGINKEKKIYHFDEIKHLLEVLLITRDFDKSIVE
ncbi:hypothetical protein BTVI_30508 [Pitangus sulphuratus]|nr:hypothetical protein BTVI_30508 [Pitangus sulphuratus]